MTKKIVQKKVRHFTKEEQHQIIQEMLDKGCTKREIWVKFTGQVEEHGQLLRWMKKFGYPTKEKLYKCQEKENRSWSSSKLKNHLKTFS